MTIIWSRLVISSLNPSHARAVEAYRAIHFTQECAGPSLNLKTSNYPELWDHGRGQALA